MKVLAARESIGEKYTEQAKEAGKKVQEMFDKSMLDARRGFAVALIMDFILFLVGVFLLVLAAVTGVMHNSSSSSSFTWEGTAIRRASVLPVSKEYR